MPLYDTECSGCGLVDEYFCSLEGHKELQAGKVGCDCGGYLSILIRPVMFVGPRCDRPLTIPNAGKAFTDPGQLREWQKANPDQQIYGPNDKIWQHEKEKLEDKVTKKLQKKGYRDRHHYSESRKAEMKRKALVNSGEAGVKKFF